MNELSEDLLILHVNQVRYMRSIEWIRISVFAWRVVVARAILRELEDIVANEEAHKSVETDLDEKYFVHINLRVQSFQGLSLRFNVSLIEVKVINHIQNCVRC